LLAHLRSRRKQRDGVVVALAHLATVKAWQQRHRLLDHGLRQNKMFTVQVVEAGRHVARHFDVLNLVAAHRHFVRLEHQNIRAHEHRVHEQAGRHVGIGVMACGVVFVHRRFIGMSAVEHAFAGHAGQAAR
jgi:hypothetical protein